MVAIETMAQLVAGFAFMAALGYGFTRLVLPEDVYEEHGGLLIYPVGYLLPCMFGFILSGSLRLAAPAATVVACAALAALTLVVVVRARKPWRGIATRGRSTVAHALILAAPMLVVMLWPFLVNGADTYLGAVNPDYFAGLVDNYFLLNGNSVADFTKGADTFLPLDYMAGSISSSGRFASGLFAIALGTLLGIEPRTALTLSIALFLLCLPLTIFVFSRVVFGLEPGAARLAAWLIGVSAPIAMSYLYFYLGQNSGLAALPLTIAIGFLLLTRPHWKLLVLFAVLVNALLVVYLGMLPYAIAPLGALGIYLLFAKRLPVRTLLAIAGGFLMVTIAINAGMLPSLYAMVRGWGNVIGQTLQGQYFLDFLTEAFIPLYLGVIVYPFQSSWFYPRFDAAIPVAFVLSIVVGAFATASAVRWTRQSADRARIVTVLSAIAIYAAVWWIYSFQRQYGYAVFKMASWLQFMLVPFAAYGGWVAFGRVAVPAAFWKRAALGAGFVCYLAGNIAATLDYGVKGLGREPEYSYIVNNFQMSGNRDYFELAPEVGRRVAANESVGLAFVDSIQNFWVSYYLRKTRVSLLAHENIPGDDENLPDIATNKIVDYYGNVREANNVFFHGAEDDYYLIPSESHINRDITMSPFATAPLWQNGTFRLFRAADNPDMVFTGRGFYRVEYQRSSRPYWWPERFRWTAEGGQVYFIRPSHPGAPHRVVFDAIVGFELRNDARTVELWADKVKFDEITVTSAGRYVSRPFVAARPVTQLVLKVRERVAPGKRKLPLWNRDIPYDYRQLNMVLSKIHVVADGKPLPRADACGRALRGNEVFRCALWFDGLQIDRWIGKRAVLGLPADFAVGMLRVTGLAPGNLGFRFPFAVRFRVNGAEVERTAAAPGPFTMDVPVAGHRPGEALHVEIIPVQAAELAHEYNVRRKLVSQSFRLESVELQ